MNVTTEVWKAIPGHEGAYEVSNFGRVRSLDRQQWQGRRLCNLRGRILKPIPNQLGYLYVNLKRNTKPIFIHRLVACGFVENPQSFTVVNHIDGNPSNNHYSNLEWCTHRENIRHAVRLGLIKSGEDSHSAKLTASDVLEIRRLYTEGIRECDLARKYDVRPSNINAIVTRKSWKHL